MGLIDNIKKYFENKKHVEAEFEELPVEDTKPLVQMPEDKIDLFLNLEFQHFFPDNGRWGMSCFKQPKELHRSYLPCHLRDTKWMAQLMHKQLEEKGFDIPLDRIESCMNSSKTFEELRHNYELEIVKWQIEFMKKGGEGWIMPEGTDEISLLFSGDVDKIFRGGIVRTLSAIGMNSEAIEEGIEKNSDMWLETYMSCSFNHRYRPHAMFREPISKPDPEHEANWLKMRRYQYYCDHKASVDKFGTPTEDMLMKPEEAKSLYEVLEVQNAERQKVVDAWNNGKVKHENLDLQI